MSLTLESIQRHGTAQAVLDTPLGPLRLVRTAGGLAGAWFEGQKHHPGELPADVRPNDPLLQRAATQLRRYFAGDAGTATTAFDLPLDLLGTNFQRAVWAALLRIPSGATCSYGDIARAIGAPQAVRAVGAAVGRNPVSLIVPCHRVVGSDGALTGYAGGIERKQALLALERAAAAPQRARA
jgi:methylated-DNA-[protein]-cysteine S-methyltransferase